ncbi:MAG: helix-turn-helix transcriptional regulator [Kiritimatiellae bacterium]|nr:helix-turn-helix transcriptional regulator [Kiritimatiellia bacterium]
MSDSAHPRINAGAYDRPFSGVGIEYFPLGVKPGRSGLTLHESGYQPENANWNFPSVFSPFWRLYYNSQPGHCVLFGERMIELTPDHLMLIPDHALFHCLGQQPVPTFWVAFSFTGKLHHDVSLPVLLSPRNTEMCLIEDLKGLIEADTAWEPTDAIYRNSLALLHVVLARPELRWQPPIPESLARITPYIEEHLTESLPNPLLAKQAGMSVTGFERAFKRFFGTTAAQYVSEMRVREAGRRLLQTSESIDGIADATGFPNRAYFSRVFKKITGEAPAAFRRSHRASLV